MDQPITEQRLREVLTQVETILNAICRFQSNEALVAFQEALNVFVRSQMDLAMSKLGPEDQKEAEAMVREEDRMRKAHLN